MAYWDQLERSHCYVKQKCNCEPMSGGLIEQPWATVTSLGWVTLGLVILFNSLKTRFRKPSDVFESPFLAEYGFQRFTGTLVFWVGISSIVLHATFTRIGDWMDFTAIPNILNLVAAYCSSIQANGSYSRRKLISVWAAISLPEMLAIWFYNQQLKFVCIGISLALLTQQLIRHRARGFRGPKNILYKALFMFFLGALTFPQDFFRPWCWPISFVDSHTIWHIVATLGTYYGLEYFRLEKLELPKKGPEKGVAK